MDWIPDARYRSASLQLYARHASRNDYETNLDILLPQSHFRAKESVQRTESLQLRTGLVGIRVAMHGAQVHSLAA